MAVFRLYFRVTVKSSKYDASSDVASSISEGDIFIYSCSAQLIESISKEINCAEHEYMNIPPPPHMDLATLLDASQVGATNMATCMNRVCDRSVIGWS